MEHSERHPRVTIVIPCYNQADLLVDCLASLVTQTFTDWEAIVVDDTSTRGSPAQAVEALGDPRVTVIRHPSNLGLGAARNTGFRAARTDLVLPLDSDDKLEPEFLQLTLAALDATPGADCVYTDFQLFGASTEIWRNCVKTARDMVFGQWIPGAGTLMHKRVWEGVGGYAEVRPPSCGNEDWDFWIAASDRGLRPVHVGKALYLYRRGPQSMSISTMATYDHAMREMIYARQKTAFDKHGAGGKFRAAGYWNSARAAARRGERLRALRLLAGHAALWPYRLLDRRKR